MADSENVYAQYELIAKDLENGVTNPGVWAKAFADSNGEEQATKALYMKLMVERALQEKARAETPKVIENADQKSAPPASVIDDQITSQPKSRRKLDWSSMPWLDRFALILSVGGTSAFIANAVTSIGLGLKFDLAQIVFNPLLGPSYFGAVLGLSVLLTRGYFRRSSQSQAKTEESYTQGAEIFARKEEAVPTDPRPSNKNEMALHGPQIAKQPGSGIDPGVYVLAGFLFVVLAVGIFIYVQHSNATSSNSSQSVDNAPTLHSGKYRDFDLNEASSGFPLWKRLVEMDSNGIDYSTRAIALINNATSGKPFVQFAPIAPDVQKTPFDSNSPYLGFIDRRMTWTIESNSLEYYVLVPNPSSEPVNEFTIELSNSRCSETDWGKNYFTVRDVDIPPGSAVAVRFQSPNTSVARNAKCLTITSLNGGKLSKVSWAEFRRPLRQTASGVIYRVLTEGFGPKPKASDTVLIHYHGILRNGIVFDSSIGRGEPATVKVNRVIAGWTEALQMMGVGSKWWLSIPPELAFGESGAGESGQIPPNATLIFEVELLDILD